MIKLVSVGLLSTACYIVYEEGRTDCVVIDPGDEPDRILAAAEGRTIAAILLTHGHFDHIGAVDGISQPGTKLMIHENDAAFLQDPSLNCCWMIDATITCRKADVLLHDGDVFEAAGLTFTVLHTPGHTAGGVCYACGQDLFTGDTMFESGYGRTDLPTGNQRELMQSLRRLMPMREDHTVHGGHC